MNKLIREDKIELLIEKIGDIRATNRGVVEFYTPRLSQQISESLLRKIAEVAVDELELLC